VEKLTRIMRIMSNVDNTEICGKINVREKVGPRSLKKRGSEIIWHSFTEWDSLTE